MRLMTINTKSSPAIKKTGLILNSMGLSVIIVSWNVKEKLKENLLALFDSQGDVSFEVFVVDNNSADGSAEMVREKFPNVKLIVNQENLGFAKANNQAIKLSVGRYALLLNPDMKVFPNTLVNLINWLNLHQQAMVTGCKLVNENGDILNHVRCFPTIWDQLAIVLKLPHLFPFVLNKYLCLDFDYNEEAEVDSVRGSFFVISRQAIDKIGLLDERYFVWFEEVDYCKRVKQAGYEIWYISSVSCVDLIGQSFIQLPRGKSQRYFRNSMLAYFKKWHPFWQYWLLVLAWPFGLFVAYIAEKIGVKNKIKT